MNFTKVTANPFTENWDSKTFIENWDNKLHVWTKIYTTLPITNEAVSLKPKQLVRSTKKAITIENVEPEIEELSESVPITDDMIEDDRPDKLSKGQKNLKSNFYRL